MLETAAIFERKATNLPIEKVQIDAIQVLTPERFRDFCQNIYAEQDFIAANIGHMYQDERLTKHCLLVLGEEEQHGVLVESEGYGYARYAAWLPNARSFVSQQLDVAARYIVNMGLAKSGGCNWSFSFGELAQSLDLTITTDNGIGSRLAEMIEQYVEVDTVTMDAAGFHIAYALDQAQTETAEPPVAMTVRDLLPLKLQDFHLLPVDEDIDVATIVELDENTLTPAGCEEYADILNAEVKTIYDGIYGLSVAVGGIEGARLTAFSYALAGYCPESEYRRLFNDQSANEGTSAQPWQGLTPQF